MNLSSMIRCPICNDRNPNARCNNCRRNRRWLDAGYPIQECKTCNIKTKLHSNQECESCLSVKGLRECPHCGEIRLALMDFYPKKGMCKECMDPRALLSTKEKVRDSVLQKKYGINLNDFTAMKVAQGGLCAICKKIPKLFVVDHDHATGKVRGLLCHGCNIGIGNLQDSQAVLKNAIDYLENNKSDNPTYKATQPVQLDSMLQIAAEETSILRMRVQNLQIANRQLAEEVDKLRVKIEEQAKFGYTEDMLFAICKYMRRILDKGPTEEERKKAVALLDRELTKLREKHSSELED
jgi:hypothetical protein